MNTKNQEIPGMAEFLAKRTVTVVAEGVRAIDPALRHCDCGCNGNYTNHTMRMGERGDFRRARYM